MALTLSETAENFLSAVFTFNAEALLRELYSGINEETSVATIMIALVFKKPVATMKTEIPLGY